MSALSLSHELTLQNEYLRAENKILKSKIKGRIRFTDDDCRPLVDAALAMGRKLMQEVASIVKPATILVWQRRLERQKWNYSARKTHRPGRPRTLGNIEALVCRMARENIWGYRCAACSETHPRCKLMRGWRLCYLLALRGRTFSGDGERQYDD